MHIVEVSFLQMLSPCQLNGKPCPASDAVLMEAKVKLPELNRFLYTAVGGDWYWVDRLGWTYQQWQQAIGDERHRTFVCYWQGTSAGYFELKKHDDDSVEIQYFGLIPRFTGIGLGGWLLSRSIEEAWNWQAKRVWVHTCTLDHPAALANYKARGLVYYGKEFEHRELAASPPGPWPAAR